MIEFQRFVGKNFASASGWGFVLLANQQRTQNFCVSTTRSKSSDYVISGVSTGSHAALRSSGRKMKKPLLRA